MKFLFESWRKHLKEEVVDAELRFLQKKVSDNGEMLTYKEEDGKHIVSFWHPTLIVDPYGEYKGESLIDLWKDIIKSGGEEMISTFFSKSMEGEFSTKEDAMEYAKDIAEMLQDVARNEEEDYEESRRQVYDREEAAARREGPSTPRSYEEIAALYDDDDVDDDDDDIVTVFHDEDDDDNDDNVVSIYENWRRFLNKPKIDPEIINMIERYVDLPVRAMYLSENNNILVQLNSDYDSELMEEMQNGWQSSEQFEELKHKGYNVSLTSKSDHIDKSNISLTKELL